MFVSFWNATALALFTLQYSYDAPDSSRYINVTSDGLLRSCVYPGDHPFKKGSNTFPRSELRLKGELKDGTYDFAVDVQDIQADPKMDYSVWQAFARDPLLMIRKRGDVKQMVVFDGKPKIQTVSEFPEKCTIVCGRKGSVTCGKYVSSGRINCKDSLYLKVGAYAQQMDPISDTCVTYGAVSVNKVK